MYVPHFNALDDTEKIRELVESVGSAELITAGAEFPMATRLPVMWDGTRLVFHMARANPHWKVIESQGELPALAVVTGPEAYISPSYYAAKAEHGRVVPTWNYSAVHFQGLVRVHRDADWLREAVTRLTETHEGSRDEPWAVSDAPADYIDKQLKAIVGIEMSVVSVQGKAKLSQNRSDADRAGVVDGLRREGGPVAALVADEMA